MAEQSQGDGVASSAAAVARCPGRSPVPSIMVCLGIHVLAACAKQCSTMYSLRCTVATHLHATLQGCWESDLDSMWDAGRAGSGSSNPSRPAAQQSPLLPANQLRSILCARTRCCRCLSKPPARLQPAAQRKSVMQKTTSINSRPCSCCIGHRLLRRCCLPPGQPQRNWPCVQWRWVLLLCQKMHRLECLPSTQHWKCKHIARF